MVQWTAVLALFLMVLSALPCIDGHGYLKEPPSRNSIDNAGSGSCPHCGNGNGVCGDGNQWPSNNYYVAAVQQPQRSYAAGSIVELEISMNVNHKGHHEFFICDRAINSDAGAVECLQKWPLLRVPPEEVHSDCQPDDSREDCQPIDPNFPGRWYHPPGMAVHKIHYRIPEGLQCSHCTLQWFWPTSNSAPYDPVSYSCYGKHLKSLGWAMFDFCGWACADSKCPNNYTPGPNRAPDPSVGSGYEEFRNCADIAVVGTAGPTPKPTTAVQSSATQTTVTAGTTVAPSTSMAEPEPEPEAESEAESEPETSTTLALTPTALPGRTCVAAPGMQLRHGVTDESCAMCPQGYQWWPCNDATLCQCTGGDAALVQQQVTPRRSLRTAASLAGVRVHTPSLIQSRSSISQVELEEEL